MKESDSGRLLRLAAKAKNKKCKIALTRAAAVIAVGDQRGASLRQIRAGEKMLDKAIRTCIKYNEDV